MQYKKDQKFSKAKAAIVAGTMALALTPTAAYATTQQISPMDRWPQETAMQQPRVQMGKMGQVNEQPQQGEQPPALPDGEQPQQGEQPPALPDGEQPQQTNNRSFNNKPIAAMKGFLQEFVKMLGVSIDDATIDEFVQSFEPPQQA